MKNNQINWQKDSIVTIYSTTNPADIYGDTGGWTFMGSDKTYVFDVIPNPSKPNEIAIRISRHMNTVVFTCMSVTTNYFLEKNPFYTINDDKLKPENRIGTILCNFLGTKTDGSSTIKVIPVCIETDGKCATFNNQLDIPNSNSWLNASWYKSGNYWTAAQLNSINYWRKN